MSFSVERCRASDEGSSSTNVVFVLDACTTGHRVSSEFTQLSLLKCPKSVLSKERCRLMDEEQSSNDEMLYNCYVMPHGEPNALARRNFGLRVNTMGKRRVLHTVDTKKVVRTLTVVEALKQLTSFLNNTVDNCQLTIAYYEVGKACLIPLLLLTLKTFGLLQDFQRSVHAFVNLAKIVEEEKNRQSHITSISLRSLCKTVLKEPTLSTTSSSERVAIIRRIVERITNVDISELDLSGHSVDVQTSLSHLESLQSKLFHEARLRPLFQNDFKADRATRERALLLRHTIAEAKLDLKALEKVFHKYNLDDSELVKRDVASLVPKLHEDQLEVLLNLMKAFFEPRKGSQKPTKKQHKGS